MKRMDIMTTAKLVAALESPNGWVRDKAQMMLLWRADRQAVPDLQRMAAHGKTAAARIQALGTLEGLSSLQNQTLTAALRDADPGVRMQALRVAENHPDDALVADAVKLVDDTNPKVRLQLACSLGAWPQRAAGEALAKLAVRDDNNTILRAAELSSLLPHLTIFAEKTQAEPTLLEPVLQTALGLQRPEVILDLVEPLLSQAETAEPSRTAPSSFGPDVAQSQASHTGNASRQVSNRTALGNDANRQE